MALQIWLPLNGNLDNLGLSPMTGSLATDSATYENGKIGQSLRISNYATDTATFSGIQNVSQWSVCLWLKLSSSDPTPNFQDFFLLTINNNGATSGGLRVEHRNTIGAFQICVPKNTDLTNANSWYTFYSNDSIAYDKWCHIAIVNDGVKYSVYLNGAFISSTNISVFSATSLSTLTGGLSLGMSGAYCWMNDFRVYDNALSASEVKQIARGLIVHYPLSKHGQDNLVVGYRNSGNLSAYSTTISSQVYEVDTDVPSGYHNKITIGTASGTGGIYFIGTTTNGNLGTQISQLTADAWYTVSYYIKSNKTHSSEITTSAEFFKNMTFIERPTINTTWQRVTFKGQYNGNTTSYLAITIYEASKWTTGELVYLSSLKVESGEVRTPWMPNSSDVLYSTVGFNNGIEYDISGYGHHGTKNGTFSYSSDTPRHSVSQVCTGTNYVSAVSPSAEVKTVSLWANWDTIPSGQSVIFLDGKSHIGLGLYSGGILCITSGLSNANAFSKSNLVANTWYHFVIVNTGDSSSSARKLYINGVEQTASSSSSNWTYGIDQTQIGKRSTTSDGFVGKLSDVRMYATALSASDVLELYNGY